MRKVIEPRPPLGPVKALGTILTTVRANRKAARPEVARSVYSPWAQKEKVQP